MKNRKPYRCCSRNVISITQPSHLLQATNFYPRGHVAHLHVESSRRALLLFKQDIINPNGIVGIVENMQGVVGSYNRVSTCLPGTHLLHLSTVRLLRDIPTAVISAASPATLVA